MTRKMKKKNCTHTESVYLRHGRRRVREREENKEKERRREKNGKKTLRG